MKKLDSDPSEWFRKADADLRIAELALNDEAPLAEIACYHAQQCAEKYLKGYLVSKQIPFKFVHELAYLVKLCLKTDPEFPSLLDPAAELQDYATDTRYPSEEFEPPTCEEAREALQRAMRIREFVIDKLKSADQYRKDIY